MELWHRSPHATFFNHPQVAERLAPKVHWWEARKGVELLAVWPVAVDVAGVPFLPPFSYYFGPMWAPTALTRSVSRQFVDRTTVYGRFIDSLVEAYGFIAAELHPGLLDVRAFDWWNFGKPRAQEIRVLPKYSARVRGLDTRSMDEVAADFRSVRRREIKTAIQHGNYEIRVNSSYEDSAMQALGAQYLATVDPLPKSQANAYMEAVHALGGLIGNGWGFHLTCYHRPTEEVVGSALVMIARGIANLAVSISSRAHRSQGVVPLLNYRAIQLSKDLGCSQFDFNGANSPRRGEDKHTYGAEEVLYFRLERSEESPSAPGEPIT